MQRIKRSLHSKRRRRRSGVVPKKRSLFFSGFKWFYVSAVAVVVLLYASIGNRFLPLLLSAPTKESQPIPSNGLKTGTQIGKTETEYPTQSNLRWLVLGTCPSQQFAHNKVTHNRQWIERVTDWFPAIRHAFVSVEPFFEALAADSHYSDKALNDFVRSELRLLNPSSFKTQSRLQVILHNNCKVVDAKAIRQHFEERHSVEGLQKLRLKNPPLAGDYPNAEDTRIAQLDWRSHEVVNAMWPPSLSTVDRHSVASLADVWGASERLSNRWQNDSFWHKDASLLPLASGRPLVVEEIGEVYDMASIRKVSCNYLDVSMPRTLSWPRKGCVSMAWIQGIFQRDEEYPQYHSAHRSLMNYSRLTAPSNYSKAQNADELSEKNLSAVKRRIARKKDFCAMAVKTFYQSSYYIDSVIRHLFHRMISAQHKYCKMVGGLRVRDELDAAVSCSSKRPQYGDYFPSGHHLLPLCFSDFKFAITMENTKTVGYTSEKIYAGLLAIDTVPVYFGNEAIGQLVNPKRIVVCNVSNEALIALRIDWKTTFKQEFSHAVNYSRKRVFERERVLDWVQSRIGAELQPCVDEVIELDSSDDLFAAKVSAPSLPSPNGQSANHYDGSVLAFNMLQLLSYLRSPILDALFVS